MKTLLSLIVAAMVVSPLAARAENRSCQLVKQLAEELNCELTVGQAPATAVDSKDFVLTSSYGPTPCKAANVLKDATRELKQDCADWLKERKADLKEKYQTGACNEECTDCSSGLRKCTVKGIVHYAR